MKNAILLTLALGLTVFLTGCNRYNRGINDPQNQGAALGDTGGVTFPGEEPAGGRVSEFDLTNGSASSGGSYDTGGNAFGGPGVGNGAGAGGVDIGNAGGFGGPAGGGGQSYVVQRGDTLWSLAKRFYGDGKRWKEIASANGITNERRLSAGQTIMIP